MIRPLRPEIWSTGIFCGLFELTCSALRRPRREANHTTIISMSLGCLLAVVVMDTVSGHCA